jgi:hypothetical protein
LVLGQEHIAITVHGEIFATFFLKASISSTVAIECVFLTNNIISINVAVIQITLEHELPGMGKAELESSQPK